MLAIELHEDEIPDFQEAVVFRLQHRYDVVIAQFGLTIPVDFRCGSAGTGIGHLPKIGIGSHAGDALGVDAQVRDPGVISFVIVLVYGEYQPIGRQLVDFGQHQIGVLDSILLEVIAKAEVAEHFKEGVMPL